MKHHRFKDNYFVSEKEYYSKKGLYNLKQIPYIKEYAQSKSNQHYKLCLLDKWNYLQGCNKVLDIGCGKGDFIELNPFLVKAQGIDINLMEVNKAKTKGLDVSCADIRKKLPFRSKSFDGISCFHVIEHLDELEFTLSEFRRVLEDGGRMVIAVPNFSFKSFYSDYTHKRPYPAPALYRVLRDNGFHNIKIMNGTANIRLLSALLLPFPFTRFITEKIIGIIKPWELIAIAEKPRDNRGSSR